MEKIRNPQQPLSQARLATAFLQYRLLGADPGRHPGNRILIPCAPKSGSTFLATLLVSLRDHLEVADRSLPFPNVPAGFANLDRTAQYDCLIDLAAPWFLGFAATWLDATPDVRPAFMR